MLDLDFEFIRKFFPFVFLLVSFPGILLKASYSSHPSSSKNNFPSSNAIGSVGDKLAGETCLFQIIGTNGTGTRPNLFPREITVLDAFDDEYGGVIVDPERLPANPNAFGYILHSSLSHWSMEVYILCLCHAIWYLTFLLGN